MPARIIRGPPTICATCRRSRNRWPAYAPLNRDTLAKFHSKFYGAGNIEFSAVGDFEPEALEKAIKTGLAGWKKAPAYTRVPNPYRDIAAKQFDIDTPDKANAFYLSRMPLKLQDTDADYAALYLGNYLFGASETSRLWNRVRETEGLSYNVRSSLSVSSFEPTGSWSMYAIYAPQNRERLEKAINEELARVLKEGFSDKEISEGHHPRCSITGTWRALRTTCWPARGWTICSVAARLRGRPRWTRRSRR